MNATCHPERRQKGGRGLCVDCYLKAWKRSHPAACHPDRSSVGKGVCDPCYRRAHGIKRPHTKRSRESNRRATLAVYGLTVTEYDALLEAQGGACAICRQPPAHGKRLHVDHDHETDVVRGLLCLPCNRAIGLLRDDPEVARRAAEYLTMPVPERRIRLVG